MNGLGMVNPYDRGAGTLAVEQGLSPTRALRLRARTSKLLGSSIQEIDVISAAVNWLNDKSTPAALVPEVEGNETLPSWFVVPRLTASLRSA
jgi:hypothetical protein